MIPHREQRNGEAKGKQAKGKAGVPKALTLFFLHMITHEVLHKKNTIHVNGKAMPAVRKGYLNKCITQNILFIH